MQLRSEHVAVCQRICSKLSEQFQSCPCVHGSMSVSMSIVVGAESTTKSLKYHRRLGLAHSVMLSRAILPFQSAWSTLSFQLILKRLGILAQCETGRESESRPMPLSLAAQCIVIGPVLGLFVCVFVCVCGSVTTITRNCVHRSSTN